jgi:hypothetical protein
MDLAGEMVAAGLHRFEAHQQPRLALRAGAGEFGVAQRLGGLGEDLPGERQRFRRLGASGGAIDAEQARFGEALRPGIDAVGEAALLAQLLEQARGHAAARRRRIEGERMHAGLDMAEAGMREGHMGLIEAAAIMMRAAGEDGGR